MQNTATPAITHQVVFKPARNGTGVVCRLPDGKIAFPSRFYWRDPAPQAYEIWEVAECGGYPHVAYVKPLRRLAAAPLGQGQPAQAATEGLLRLAALAAAARKLFHRRRRTT